MIRLEDQHVVGYISADRDRLNLNDRRLARARYVRNLVRTVYEADKKYRINPADADNLDELVDAPEDYLDQITRNVGAVPAQPNRHGGETP